MLMNYRQAMEYLGLAMKFGSRLGLERMEELMRLLGNPAMDIPAIHIAGTNGKGSVSTMIANCMAAAGYKVGLYTSPYINRFSERIRVLNKRQSLDKLYTDETEGEIGNEEISLYISDIREKIQIMTETGYEHPTEFEIVTAAAFIHFENNGCEYMVLETGLGGRLDSTNIIRSPELCIITPVGYDHMDRLGETISEIAYEKAGIIKKGAKLLICNPYNYTTENDADSIRKVMDEKIKNENISDFKYVSSEYLKLVSYDMSGQKFTYCSENIPEMEYYTPLLGEYQPMNCTLVIESCFNICGYENVHYGISKTKWPARLEVLKDSKPEIILDGAHNRQGVSALIKTLERLFAGRNIVFLCGVMKDKDYRNMIENISDSDKYSTKGFFCTEPDNPRALESYKLAEVIKEILDKKKNRGYNISAGIFCEKDPQKALIQAFRYAKEKDGLVVAFGSLYMAGKIRDAVKNF